MRCNILNLTVAGLLGFTAIALLLRHASLAETLTSARSNRAAIERIRHDVAFLASDALRGRAAGTPQYDEAVRYTVRALEDADVAPFFGDSYEQPIEFTHVRFARRGAMVLESAEGPERLEVLRDIAFFWASKDRSWDRPLEIVFAGLGIHEPGNGWDDYMGLDLENKCALMVADTPSELAVGLPEELRQRYQDMSYGPKKKAAAAAEHGAICVLALLSPLASAEMRGIVSDPQVLRQTHLFSTHDAVPRSVRLAAVLSAQSADVLFESQMQRPTPGRRPRGFALTRTARFDVHWESYREVVASNVGAWIPGRDPEVASQVLVLSAHLDGQGMRGSEVLNSANDNASSVAALLEAARQLAGRAPRRSIAFLFPTAEEDGLLGSKHFVDHPPIGFEQIRFSVNMEMVGKPERSGRYHVFRVSGRHRSEIEGLVRAIENRVAGVRFNYSLRSDEDGLRLFRNSDHVPFFLRGVPTLYFWGGSESYHQPSDDADAINYEKVAKMAEILVALAEETDRRDLAFLSRSAN